MWSELWRLRGALIVAAFAVATLWLGATGKLTLYIHPRYELFTLILAAVALAGCGGAVVLAALRSRRFRAAVPLLPLHAVGGDHDHAHETDPPPRTLSGRLIAAAALVVSGAVTVAALTLPPTTLSSATAMQRDIVGASAAAAQDSTALVESAAGSAEVFATFTVRDWAALLHQSSDPGFFAGKPVDVVGFVTPHPDDPEQFFVSRFAISCCAIDAMPFGAPVLVPGWAEDFAADSWVRVTGEFVPAAGGGMVLEPGEVAAVDEPAEPYLF